MTPKTSWLPIRFLLVLLGSLSSIAVPGQTYAQLAPVTAEQLLTLRTEARSYEHGEGVPRNVKQAIALYCEGARLGDAEAQFSLGWIYANGRGIARADDIAAFFFARAAEQGHEHARRMLRSVGEPGAEPPECFRPKRSASTVTAHKATSEATVESLPEFVAITQAQKLAAELVHKLAPEYGISPRLALAVIRAESNFNPKARSEKNAQGLMQLIPETAVRFNVTKPFDPAQNVRGGLAYLRWLMAYFKGNVPLVAAAYNAGEGTVNRYRGIPPYAETRGYVQRVMQWVGMTEHPYDASVTSPSPVLSLFREKL